MVITHLGYWVHVFNKLAWLLARINRYHSLYAFENTNFVQSLVFNSIYTPVALSIVQARFVGLVHFGTGFILTYPPLISGFGWSFRYFWRFR